MSLEIVRVFASIRVCAWLKSAPNTSLNLDGSALESRSNHKKLNHHKSFVVAQVPFDLPCKAADSDIFRKLRSKVGPIRVEAVAANKNRP